MDKKSLLFYERWALRDFSDKMMARYEKQLTNEEKDIIAAKRRRNEEFLREHPFSSVKANFAPFISKSRRMRPLPGFPVFAQKVLVPAFSCILLLTFFFFIRENQDIRYKGNSPGGLVIYREKADGQEERLDNGDLVRAGDLLQVAYGVRQPRYGMILSVDGNGNITYHYPRTPGFALEMVNEGEEVLLPYSCRLDAAPDYELFLLITEDNPFSIEQVYPLVEKIITAVDHNQTPLTKYNEWDINTILLKKEEK